MSDEPKWIYRRGPFGIFNGSWLFALAMTALVALIDVVVIVVSR